MSNQWPPPRPALPPGYMYEDEYEALVRQGSVLPPGARILTPGELPLDTGPAPVPPPAMPVPAPPGGGRWESSEEAWESVDSIRWGNRADVAQAAAVGAPFAATTQQLSHIKVPRPLVWLVQLNATGKQVPAGEVAPITVTFRIVFGSGAANDTMLPSIVLTAANGYKLPAGTAPPQFFVPAADLQADASITYTPTVAGPAVIAASVMCAPWGTLIPGKGPRR